MTQQGDMQAFFRAIGGSASDYNTDFLTAAATESFTGEFNGVFIQWLQDRTGSSSTNLDGLKQEFAELAGAHNWQSVGGVPIILEGCQLWLDGADISPTNIVQTAGKVSQWSDKSGQVNNFTQGTADEQPLTNSRTINTKNAIDYDGSDDNLEKSSFTSILSRLNAFSVFVVFQLDVADTTSKTLFASSIESTNRTIIQKDNSEHLICATFSGSWNQKTVAFTDTASAHIVTMLNSSGGVNTSFLDGTEMTLTVETPSSSTTAITTVGANTGNVANWEGLIAEIIVYNREVSAVERTSVESYLSNKWATT